MRWIDRNQRRPAFGRRRAFSTPINALKPFILGRLFPARPRPAAIKTATFSKTGDVGVIEKADQPFPKTGPGDDILTLEPARYRRGVYSHRPGIRDRHPNRRCRFRTRRTNQAGEGETRLGKRNSWGEGFVKAPLPLFCLTFAVDHEKRCGRFRRLWGRTQHEDQNIEMERDS